MQSNHQFHNIPFNNRHGQDVIIEESYSFDINNQQRVGQDQVSNIENNMENGNLLLAFVFSLMLQGKKQLENLKSNILFLCKKVISFLGLEQVIYKARKLILHIKEKKQKTVVNLKTLKYVSAMSVVAGAYWVSKQGERNKNRKRAKRVAVIGSGVAGTGAAWSLNRAGIDCVVYEKKPKVGGNAKKMVWNVEGQKIETGLAVFAWPESLFHNYNAMIEECGIETEDHDTRFFIGERLENGTTKCVYAHGKENWEPEQWVKDDLALWDSLCIFVKRVNGLLQPSETPSLYRMGFANFLNMIPLRKVCKMWGLSDRFWKFIFVPIHTSTFLEVDMDTVPASMAELLDEIVPFSRTPNMRTWKTHAHDAIKTMLSGIDQKNIRTSCAVETIEYFPKEATNGDPAGYDITIVDEDGNREIFDAVIFACSAQGMNRVLHGKGEPLPGVPLIPNPHNGLNNESKLLSSLKAKAFNAMETTLLSNTLYTTDRDATFERGIVHSSGDAVLPNAFKDEILDSYCNYIEVDSTNPTNLENSFVISSWAPTAQKPDVKGKLPMLVTYNADKKLEGVDTEWVSTSREAHPCLTFLQLGSSVMLWPVLQGARRDSTYFCGSAVLPANGHDLSFLSGLVAASELGAPYPFPNNKNAYSDYLRLRNMMLSIWA